MAPRRRPVQQPLVVSRRGGARAGAGRPKSPHSGVSHLRREGLTRHQPVHVTLKVRAGLPNLRSPRLFQALQSALRAAALKAATPASDASGAFGRVCHFSVQHNQLHLLIEAADEHSLSRTMQGLTIRMAKALNRALDRSGKVFADRYHEHVLRTPREVRRALNYIAAVDYCSSLRFRVELTLPPTSDLLRRAEPQLGIARHPLAPS